MDSKTQDSYSSAFVPALIGIGGGFVVAGLLYTVGPMLYNLFRGRPMSDAERQQSESAESLARITEKYGKQTNPTATAPLLQEQPSTGGRRLTRHRKNRSRKTRCKRRT
jgi:hypothetical protein